MKPDYAGNNWVDNGSGSWIAPIQPDAFMQPKGYAPPQQFGEWNNYGKPTEWQPEPYWQPPQFDQGFQQPMAYQPPYGEYFPQPMAYQPPQGNWQPPQGDYFMKPDYAGNDWVDNVNGSWIAPIQPDAFMQPFMDASGFPVSLASSLSAASAGTSSTLTPAAEFSSGDGAEFDNVADQDQIPNQ